MGRRALASACVLAAVACATPEPTRAAGLAGELVVMDSSGWSYGAAVAVAEPGDFAVIGGELVAGEERNLWITAYDREGRRLWRRTHNGAGNGDDYGLGVAIGPGGDVYVTGGEVVAPDQLDVWLRKYDAAGNVAWTQTHAGAGGSSDLGYGVALTPAGDIVVAGVDRPPGRYNDVWVRKYSPGGAVLWTRGHGGPGGQHDAAQAVAVDPLGDITVAGYETQAPSDDFLNFTIWIRQYDPAGTERWTRTVPGDGSARGAAASGVAVDPSGNVHVCGAIAAGGALHTWVAKYDRDGNPLWSRTGAPGGASEVAVDAAGNVYVTGTLDETAPDSDVWIAKYDHDGEVLWSIAQDGSGHRDVGYGIAVDRATSIAVTGYWGIDDTTIRAVVQVLPQ